MYRLSEHDFHEDLQSLIERQTQESLSSSSDYWPARTPEQLADDVERNIRMRYGRAWQYNEAIGWIRLYQDGGSIKGQLWHQSQRTYRRNFSHTHYQHRGRVYEFHHYGGVTSEDIYRDIEGALSKVTAQEGSLHGRWVDLTAFRAVGPHIDWMAVLGWRD